MRHFVWWAVLTAAGLVVGCTDDRNNLPSAVGGTPLAGASQQDGVQPQKGGLPALRKAVDRAVRKTFDPGPDESVER